MDSIMHQPYNHPSLDTNTHYYYTLYVLYIIVWIYIHKIFFITYHVGTEKKKIATTKCIQNKNYNFFISIYMFVKFINQLFFFYIYIFFFSSLHSPISSIDVIVPLLLLSINISFYTGCHKSNTRSDKEKIVMGNTSWLIIAFSHMILLSFSLFHFLSTIYSISISLCSLLFAPLSEDTDSTHISMTRQKPLG